MQNNMLVIDGAVDKFNLKFLKNKNRVIFIIFYNDWCGFCQKALELLKKHNLSFKGYKIDKIKGKLPRLLDNLKKMKDTTLFDENHTTIPIIFKNGTFIGGYDKLLEFIK